MSPNYILYIDEAGDPGTRRVSPIDKQGGSEWFLIGAVLVRAKYEQEVVSWVKDIRMDINSRQKPDLHFKNLSPTKKRRVCELLSEKPIRTFVIASNKKNMRQHRNTRAEARPNKDWFYNFCVRLLLERASALCRRDSINCYGKPTPLRVYMSERGGHDYQALLSYISLLRTQATTGLTYLGKRLICPSTIDLNYISSQRHKAMAGLQLADIVASSFYQAVHTEGPGEWRTDYAELIAPTLAKENGSKVDFGLCLLPTPPWKADLNTNQRVIFEKSGYDFTRKSW